MVALALDTGAVLCGVMEIRYVGRGQKYELYRSTWTAYSNFADMCDHNYKELELAGAAELLGKPEWQDKEDNLVKEVEAFGFKVTHNLIHPEYCVVMDKVGGNIHMTGNGDIRGGKYLCENGTTNESK